MNETDIRKFAGLMQELGLTGLEITEENKMVRLERNLLSHPQEQQPITEYSAINREEEGSSYISIKSPMVGVFYEAPAENASPYVSVGDRVEKGKVLCIIEAMKLMNEICAEECGLITEICVKNGQVVEYGTELFRIGGMK